MHTIQSIPLKWTPSSITMRWRVKSPLAGATPVLCQHWCPPKTHDQSALSAILPTEGHPLLVRLCNQPRHLPSVRRHHVWYTLGPWWNGNVPSMGCPHYHQNDWCHIFLRQELLLVIQEHCQGVLPHVQHKWYCHPIQGIQHPMPYGWNQQCLST